MAALWWFSEPVWQSLPKEIQDIIEQGFEHQQKAANDLVFNQEANSYKLFEKAGGTVYRPTLAEKQAFKEASRNMRQWFEDNYGSDWLQLLTTSVAQCDANAP